MPYTDALEKLERLGVTNMLAGCYERNGQYCVFGHIAPSTRKFKYEDIDIGQAAAMSSDVMDELWALNMSIKEARWLQRVCDGFEPTHEERIFGTLGETSERRCWRVLNWLRLQEDIRTGALDIKAQERIKHWCMTLGQMPN